MKRHRLLLAVLLFAGITFAWAPSTQAAGHAVEMRNNSYNPPDLTVGVGDTVVWHNYDAENHSVVGGPVNSPDVTPGGEFSWTFSGPGDVSYTCRFHPYMTGVVHVASAGAPTPAPAAAPPASGDDDDATPPATPPVTAAPMSSGTTAPPPAAFKAIASQTAMEPTLLAETTTTVPTITPTTAPPTTVRNAAIGLADKSSSSRAPMYLGGLVLLLALGVWFGVRALRKDFSS